MFRGLLEDGGTRPCDVPSCFGCMVWLKKDHSHLSTQRASLGRQAAQSIEFHVAAEDLSHSGLLLNYKNIITLPDGLVPCLSIPASYCQGFRFVRVCNKCSLCEIGGDKKRTDSKLLQLHPHFCLAKVWGRSRWHHQSLVWRNFFSSLVTDNAFISPLKEDSLQ